MEQKEFFKGTVVFFNTKRGYGFIEWEIDGVKQKDIFVHFSDINMAGFKNLFAKQKVTFTLGKNNSGVVKAVEVELKPEQETK